MKIAVVGAGAMGSLFGAKLNQTPNSVILVDLWQDHIKKMNEEGLLVETGEQKESIPVRALVPEDVREKVDLVLLFTKTFHTHAALAGMGRALDSTTHVVTLQNGVGQVDIIKQFVNINRINHGITTYPCTLVGPGHIRTESQGYVKMMAVNGEISPVLESFNEALENAGMNSDITPDVTVAIWEKLAFNSAMNALTATLRITVGQIDAVKEGRELAFSIVDEAVAVALAKGIAVDDQRIAATMEMAFAQHKSHRPSMLQDVEAQRATEIDFINGAIVREAKDLGIATPINETLLRLVKTVEASYSRHNG
ncbi:MAG: 2-dehydropantoate 2-reductase [Desulfobacterium sp.]